MVLNVAICDRARMARDARFDGRFFIAVLSTGIYCRPICPSPHARRENVRYFRSADEAVAAGFRACLRCRPEAAPGTPRWNGTASTVSRALRLIEEGALQDAGLSSLSRRLGVSARQLHRLFSIHLGTSPTAVAKTWRLNFATQLLRETDWPMGRVALDAGFRTVRRFNDAIRARYGRTPSDVRRDPGAFADDREGYVARLPYRAPYDWDSQLEFLGARTIPGVEEVVSGTYRRTISHEGRHGILEVRHDLRRRALDVRVRVASLASLLPLLTRVRGMFDLDSDTTEITQHLGKEPLLAGLVRRHPGLRLPGAWDPFEMSVRAVLGESFAGGVGPGLCDLVRRLGEPLRVPNAGRLNLVFPSPGVLAKARLAGWPSDQARPIRSLAEAALSSADEESLTSVTGLADSMAQYIAVRAFRQPDAFPLDDPVLLHAADPGGSPTHLTALAQRCRPWRAYAAVYLWRTSVEPRSSRRRFGGDVVASPALAAR